MPILAEFFDQYEFDDIPVKRQINNDIYLTLNKYISNNYYYKISENLLTLSDSYISDLLPPLETSYIDVRSVHL